MVDADYPAYLQPLPRDLLFLPEKRVINGVTKLVCTFYNKKLCIWNMIIKTSFKMWFNSKKTHVVIKLNRKRVVY